MENWKQFLNESGDPYIEDLALYTENRGGMFYLILYKPKISRNGWLFWDTRGAGGRGGGDGKIARPVIVAYLGVNKLSSKENPCVPHTFQVRYSATNSNYQRKGYGTFMYKLLAAVIASEAGDNGGGITSDHIHSSSPGAKATWNKIDSRVKDLERRETEMGNDEFDYDGKLTPNDPQDDCKLPPGGKKVTAADHSYRLTNKKYIEVYNDLINKHSEIMKTGLKRGPQFKSSAYENLLLDLSSKQFSTEYQKADYHPYRL